MINDKRTLVKINDLLKSVDSTLYWFKAYDEQNKRKLAANSLLALIDHASNLQGELNNYINEKKNKYLEELDNI